MNLQSEYWDDVVAVRPDEVIDRQVEDSLAFRSTHTEFLNIAYGPHERQKLDLFLPRTSGSRNTKPWPLLVFIHGGYWQFSQKEHWAFIAPEWLEHGVACACIGYRLAPEARIDQIEADVLAALSCLNENAWRYPIDRDRILLSGQSAGGHLTSLAMSSGQTTIKAAAMLSGIYDLRPLQKTAVGKPLLASVQLPLTDTSPLGREVPEQIPCQIVWGAAETAVFHSQSKLLLEYWRNWGLDVAEECVENANHYSIINSLIPSKQGVSASFIMQHLLY